MTYRILHSESELYLPKIEHWIIKDLKLKLIEAMLYKIILIKGFLTWDAKYIGEVLVVSRSTVLRMVDKLCQLGLAEKRLKTYGSRTRWVLVARYTVKGERSEAEIENLFKEGFRKLDCDTSKYRGYSNK